jgi:hypothetical protein
MTREQGTGNEEFFGAAELRCENQKLHFSNSHSLSENAVIPHPSTGWGCKAGKN